MKEKLQQKLYKKYPKLFENEIAFEFNDGWYWLIDNALGTIQAHCNNINRYSEDEEFQVTVMQLKEKLGTLRLYLNSEDEEISGIIYLAENMSESICETCGSTTAKIRGKYWLYTACDKCEKKMNRKKIRRNIEYKIRVFIDKIKRLGE